MKKILVHGSGHRANSWNDTISYLENAEDVLCPDLSTILHGEEASYGNLYAAFAKYCNEISGKIHLCGISLGGILALQYALDFPDKVTSLVLIGTPHKVPKVMFCIQNMMFRLLPASMFENMAFCKKDTFVLGNSMKDLDFCDKVQKIRCPTLIICGENDRANIKSAHYFHQNIENAQLRLIENTGHIVNEESPKALAEVLNEQYGEKE